MVEDIEWLETETWEEHLWRYPHPKAITFPDNYDMADAICVAGEWCYDWETEGKMSGVVLKLLTDKAFEAFPEAPKEGKWKGMLWFQRDQVGLICALEERLGLHFHGLAHVC